MKQEHLNYKEMVNLGSYYTNKEIVDRCYDLINKNIKKIEQFTLIDTSCGYGSFLKIKNNFKKIIGADIDKEAIKYCKSNLDGVELFVHNSLFNVSRKQYNLNKEDKIVIIGNPPYNDITSQSHKRIKDNNMKIDKDLIRRDLGMSFLLSYQKLQADYICVLHPLSFLIKETNFKYLKNFFKSSITNNMYKLIDCSIISSSNFDLTSKKSQFPIIIAFYKKDNYGMTYEDVKDFKFKIDDKTLCLNDFEYISKYIDKYPNKNKVLEKDVIAKFYTLRDINALKRSATFIQNDMSNTIYVTKNNFKYYCYVDVFKEYCDKMPYYMGNLDIIINNNDFLKISDSFIQHSLNKHKFLNFSLEKKIDDYESNIKNYFNNLFIKI